MGQKASSIPELPATFSVSHVANRCFGETISQYVADRTFEVYHSQQAVPRSVHTRVAETLARYRTELEEAAAVRALWYTPGSLVDPEAFAERVELPSVAGEPRPHVQWCPCEIEVNLALSRVLGMSHVEHVDHRAHNDVYQALMSVFEASLPALERVLLANELPLLQGQQQHTEKPHRRPKLHRSRNRKLQVVVKIKEAELEPHSNYEGQWHMEGIPDDDIAAVVLYYYRFDPEIKGGQLQLRPQIVSYYFAERTYAFGEDDAKISVEAGTMLVFSNKNLVHRVALVENDSDKRAGRGYMAFFVIDPNKPYKHSTAKRPCCDLWARARELDRMFGAPYQGMLPIEVLHHICEFVDEGHSMQRIEENKAWYQAQREKHQAKVASLSKMRPDAPHYQDGWCPVDGGFASYR